MTKASHGRWVVCHLFRDEVGACAVMSESLGQLAAVRRSRQLPPWLLPASNSTPLPPLQLFPETRFVQAVSTDCIPNFPNQNLPTLLVYRDGKCVENFAGLKPYLGIPSAERESREGQTACRRGLGAPAAEHPLSPPSTAGVMIVLNTVGPVCSVETTGLNNLGEVAPVAFKKAAGREEDPDIE